MFQRAVTSINIQTTVIAIDPEIGHDQGFQPLAGQGFAGHQPVGMCRRGGYGDRQEKKQDAHGCFTDQRSWATAAIISSEAEMIFEFRS